MTAERVHHHRSAAATTATAVRDALLVGHFANQGVYSILDLVHLLVATHGGDGAIAEEVVATYNHSSSAAHAHAVAARFTQCTGLAAELGVVYLFDLVRERGGGSLDWLCRRRGGHWEAPLTWTQVALLKQRLAECPELAALDAAASLDIIDR